MESSAGFRLPSISADEIPCDEALAAVLGYARATRDLVIRRTPTYQDGMTVSVPAYAYAVYDCVLPSDDDGFAWLDALVVDGLNGKMDQKAITALKHAADRAWPHVRDAVARAGGRAFWELPAEDAARVPPAGSAGEAMANAWQECFATGGIKTALTHKLLHHKRPDLFPSSTIRRLPLLTQHTDEEAVGPWAIIHRELQANEESFIFLEQEFARLVNGKADVPLARLRLHDILLWLTAAKKWDHAVSRGRETEEWKRWQNER